MDFAVGSGPKYPTTHLPDGCFDTSKTCRVRPASIYLHPCDCRDIKVLVRNQIRLERSRVTPSQISDSVTLPQTTPSSGVWRDYQLSKQGLLVLRRVLGPVKNSEGKEQWQHIKLEDKACSQPPAPLVQRTLACWHYGKTVSSPIERQLCHAFVDPPGVGRPWVCGLQFYGLPTPHGAWLTASLYIALATKGSRCRAGEQVGNQQIVMAPAQADSGSRAEGDDPEALREIAVGWF